MIEQGRYTHYIVVDEKINQILSITPHLRKSNKEIVGYKPKEKPSEQFYEEIKNIHGIGNNINQIARIANAKGVIDVPHLRKEIDKLDEFIIDMKNKYLRPDKDE